MIKNDVIKEQNKNKFVISYGLHINQIKSKIIN